MQPLFADVVVLVDVAFVVVDFDGDGMFVDADVDGETKAELVVAVAVGEDVGDDASSSTDDVIDVDEVTIFKLLDDFFDGLHVDEV